MDVLDDQDAGALLEELVEEGGVHRGCVAVRQRRAQGWAAPAGDVVKRAEGAGVDRSSQEPTRQVT